MLTRVSLKVYTYNEPWKVQVI